MEPEADLFKRRDTDAAAREELIARKLPLAHALARRFSGTRTERDDLHQVAALALIKAVDRFDLARGCAFSSFAVPTITGELRRYLRDTTWAVHVPRSVQEAAIEIHRVAESLTATLGRGPTHAEIANATGRTSEQVIEALEATNALSATSLDATPADGSNGEAPAHERIGSVDEQLEHVERRATCQSAVRLLPRGQRELLRLRFEEGLTQREIGARMGCSQMHVSRLMRRALDRASILARADAA
jgi:RNA polymerase sigma-B factor